MPRFFVGRDSIDGERLRIGGDDAFHIARALRMAVGDSLTVCDDIGREYDCVLASMHDSEVICRICGVRRSTAEPSVKIRAMDSGQTTWTRAVNETSTVVIANPINSVLRTRAYPLAPQLKPRIGESPC